MLEASKRVLIFGASGRIGRRVAAEALRRGHAVVGVVRSSPAGRRPPEGLEVVVGDARAPAEVRRLSRGVDVVISATRPAKGREAELVEVATSLLAGLRGASVPLVLVGGAARLDIPGTGGRRVLDDPRLVHDAWRDLAAACVDQLAVCERAPEVPWTYVSPPAFLEEAPPLGAYRLGTDELVVDERGASRMAVEDFALAVVDAAEDAVAEAGGRRLSVGPGA